MIVTPGKYLAKVNEYGISETSKGNPQIVISFAFHSHPNKSDQKSEKIILNWYGSLKQGRPAEITFDVLFACGFLSDDISLLAAGKDSNSLSLETDMEITVAKEEYEGQTRLRIKWVSLPNRADRQQSNKRKISIEDMRSKSELNPLNLAMAERRKNLKVN